MNVKGLVVGSFDALNIGHIHAVREATRQCDELIIAVASDEEIAGRTGSSALVGQTERIELVTAFFPEARVGGVASIRLEDLKAEYCPDVIFLTDPTAIQPIQEIDPDVLIVSLEARYSSSAALITLDREILWTPA